MTAATSSTELVRALADYTALDIGDDVPATVTPSWVADKFGVSLTSVYHSIKTGKLPSTPITDAANTTVAYSINPVDAFLIWGHRRLAAAKGRAAS